MSQPAKEGPGSVSRIECSAVVKGKGSARISLYRHLAPLTVDAIGWALPIDSRVNIQRAMVCMFTNIRVGVEKPKTSFERGDVAFLPLGSLICIFLGEAKSGASINPVGKVDSGLEVLDSLRPGDVVKLAKGAA